MKNAIKLVSLTVDLLILDQITKYISKVVIVGPLEIISNFFRFEYVENTGIAFSLPVPYPLIIISNILLIGFLIYLAIEELDINKVKTRIPMALLIAGGIGNLIDRLFHGFVIDFISIWKYPFFNLADIYIITAVLLLVVFYDKIKRVKNKNI